MKEESNTDTLPIKRCEKCRYFKSNRCYANPPQVVFVPHGPNFKLESIRPNIKPSDIACHSFTI